MALMRKGRYFCSITVDPTSPKYEVVNDSIRREQRLYRTFLLSYYRRDKNAIQTVKKFIVVHATGAMTVHQIKNWFTKLLAGNFFSKVHHVREHRLKLISTHLLIRTGEHVRLH